MHVHGSRDGTLYDYWGIGDRSRVLSLLHDPERDSASLAAPAVAANGEAGGGGGASAGDLTVAWRRERWRRQESWSLDAGARAVMESVRSDRAVWILFSARPLTQVRPL